MRRILPILISIVLLTSCGVGSYTISSGRADGAGVFFTAAKAFPVEVCVDGSLYSVSTVKAKAYKNDRRIRKTSENMIMLPAGKHEVEVRRDGNVLYSKVIFISSGENRVIEL